MCSATAAPVRSVAGTAVPCEIIGFSGPHALAMPFGSLQGVRRGCPARVRAAGA